MYKKLLNEWLKNKEYKDRSLSRIHYNDKELFALIDFSQWLNKKFTENSKELAILFHETYERLTPEFVYETRKETRQFDEESNNGKLMIAVCREILLKVLKNE